MEKYIGKRIRDWEDNILERLGKEQLYWENDDKWLGRKLDCWNLLGIILGTVRTFLKRKQIIFGTSLEKVKLL